MLIQLGRDLLVDARAQVCNHLVALCHHARPQIIALRRHARAQFVALLCHARAQVTNF
jgi:hypothetical protein